MEIISVQDKDSFIEDYIKSIVSSNTPILSNKIKLGSTEAEWEEVEPGLVRIYASGGSAFDRSLGRSLLQIELEERGYRLAQIPMDIEPSSDLYKESTITHEGKTVHISSWQDVMAKAKRLIQSGQVQVLRNGYHEVAGRVQGDHGIYEPTIERQDPESRSISSWSCQCRWSDYSWGRTRKWKKYEGRPCMLGKTIISMADGSYKEIKDIEVGDEVLTHSGVGIVSRTMVNPYEGDLASITTFGYDEPLKLTPKHRVYAYGTPQRFRKDYQYGDQGFKIWDEDFLFTEDPEWIEPLDLKSHDWLTGRIRTETFGGPFDFTSIIPDDWECIEKDGYITRIYSRKIGHNSIVSSAQYKGSIPRYIYPSHDLMIIMGLYSAEGSFERYINGHPAQVVWSFNKNEVNTLGKQLTESLERLGFGKPSCYIHKIANTSSFKITNHPLALFLKTICGQYSQDKTNDSWLLYLSPDYQKTFLNWAWMGDGHQSPNDTRKHLSTSSDHLAWQTHDMLLRCGYIPSWDRSQQNGGPNNRDKKYTINRISWVEERFNSNKGSGRRILTPEIYATKIRNVEYEPFKGDVYNLEVLPQHSYVANGKIVKNCSHVLALYWKSLSTPLDEDVEPGANRGPNPSSPLPSTPQRSFGPEEGEEYQYQSPFGTEEYPGEHPAIEDVQEEAQEQNPRSPGFWQNLWNKAKGFGNRIRQQGPLSLIPPFPGRIEPTVSVPGEKQPTPADPIQNRGGTFSSVTSALKNGDMVQIKNEDIGTWVGINGGGEGRIPRNSIGEVLGVDPTGMINVYFAGPASSNGKLEPHGITAWVFPSEIIERPDVRPGGPAVRRR